MYICPICHEEFSTEEYMKKHLGRCWSEKNLNHKSKPAPRSEDIVVREVEAGVLDFFNKFKGDPND